MPSATRKGKGKAHARTEIKIEAALPLGKQLAHTDKAVRDGAIQNLKLFLSRGGELQDGEGEGSSGYVRLSESEMAKLWKGLFYCFWMSDKPLVQQGLASDLANLLLTINPRVPKADKAAARLDAALAFLEGFWVAMVREWSGIDRLRMDKFYMLIRRYVNATFRLLARAEWSDEAVSAVNAILSAKSGPMSWQDRSVPQSLSTHLADIYLDELDKVLGTPEAESQPAAPLVAILAPHTALLARTPNPIVRDRLMSVVYTPLLAALNSDSDELHNIADGCSADSSKEMRDTPAAVRKALLGAMFKEAAQESAVESNRRKIYQVVREEADDDDE